MFICLSIYLHFGSLMFVWFLMCLLMCLFVFAVLFQRFIHVYALSATYASVQTRQVRRYQVGTLEKGLYKPRISLAVVKRFFLMRLIWKFATAS